jgi:hypothetical protein
MIGYAAEMNSFKGMEPSPVKSTYRNVAFDRFPATDKAPFIWTYPKHGIDQGIHVSQIPLADRSSIISQCLDMKISVPPVARTSRRVRFRFQLAKGASNVQPATSI